MFLLAITSAELAISFVISTLISTNEGMFKNNDFYLNFIVPRL